MAVRSIRLGPWYMPSGAPSLLWTVPAGRTWRGKWTIYNFAPGAATISLWTNGTIDAKVLWRGVVPGATPITTAEDIILNAGDQLYGGSSVVNGALINLHGSLLLGVWS